LLPQAVDKVTTAAATKKNLNRFFMVFFCVCFDSRVNTQGGHKVTHGPQKKALSN
jgi:Rieske Fe-S protein